MIKDEILFAITGYDCYHNADRYLIRDERKEYKYSVYTSMLDTQRKYEDWMIVRVKK